MDEGLKYVIDFCTSADTTIERAHLVLACMRLRLTAVQEQDGLTSFALGGMLKRLKENDLWKGLAGIPAWWEWADFCKSTTGKSVQTCYAKMRVWEKSQKVGMQPEEIDALGWGVADKILSESKSRADVDRLLAVHQAAGSRDSFLEQMAAVDAEKPLKQQRAKMRVVKLKKEQEDFFDQTLEVAAKRAGKELYKNMSQEEALIFALADWREGLS